MTTALSLQSPSDRMSFLLSLKIETKDPERIISFIGSKIFKEGETQVKVTLGKKSVIVTKEKIPEFMKSLIAKSTKSMENQKELSELLSKTFALRPILEKKTYCSLVNTQLKKLSSLLEKSIEQQKDVLCSSTLDEEAQEKALSPIFEQGTELLEVLRDLRVDFAGDREITHILGSFFSQITKKITAFSEFSRTGFADELQTALAPLMFSVELIEKEEDPQKVQAQLQKIVEPMETERVSKMAANATTPVQQTAAKTNGVFWHALRGVLLLATAGLALFQNKIPISEGGLQSPPGLEKQFIGNALLLGLSELLPLFPVTEKVLEKIGVSLLQKVISSALSFYGGTPIAKIAANMAVSELLKKVGRLAAYHTVGKRLPSSQQKFLSMAGNFVLSYATGYCAKKIVNEAFTVGSEIFSRLNKKIPPQVGQVALSVLGSVGLMSFAAVARQEPPLPPESPSFVTSHTFEDMSEAMEEALQDEWEKMDPEQRAVMEAFMHEPVKGIEIDVEEAAGEFLLTQALLEEKSQAEKIKTSLEELQAKIPAKVTEIQKQAVALGNEIQKFIGRTSDPEFEKKKKAFIDESWATFCWAHMYCESTHNNLLGLLERANKAEQEARKRVDDTELFISRIQDPKKSVNIPYAKQVSSLLTMCKENALQATTMAMMSRNRVSMLPYIRIGGVVKEMMNVTWKTPPTEKFIRETIDLFTQNIGFMYTKPFIAQDEKIRGEIEGQLRLLQKKKSPEEALRLLQSLHSLITKTLFSEFVALMYNPLPMDDDAKVLNVMKQKVELLQKTQSLEEAKKLQESIQMLRLVISERLDLYKEIIEQSEHLNKVQSFVEHRPQVLYQNGLSTYKYACSRWEASLQKASEYEGLGDQYIASLKAMSSQAKGVKPKLTPPASKLFDPELHAIESLLTRVQETDPQKKKEEAYFTLAQSSFDEVQKAKKGKMTSKEYRTLVDKTLVTLDTVSNHLSCVYEDTGKGVAQAKKLMTSSVSTLEAGSSECLKAHKLMEKTLSLCEERASLFERLQKVREFRAAAKNLAN